VALEGPLSQDFDQAVRRLCQLALDPDPERARDGVDGIFRHGVEAMGDAFDPRLCDLYIRFFARVLSHTREAAPRLDERLRRFGLFTEQDLIDRAHRVRRIRRAPASGVRKILVLSRVTLGADVAVTSVVLRKMMLRFPEARLVLLGGQKTALLFAGEPRVEVRLVEYPRSGGLIERLESWAALADAVEDELAGLPPEQCLVLDPDSRLTQLGMLPVVAGDCGYHFFESRSFTRPGAETLAQLIAAWLAEVFGPDASPLYPWVSIERAPVEAGARCVSVNLGVGDNPSKRIPDPFELRLLTALIDAGWRIHLDTGDGAEETARVERLLSQLEASGRAAAVIPWRGSLAGFAARIAASDLYVGYDSACQHIAAALGIKTIDIFSGFRAPRMVERWRPFGPGEVRMIVVDPNAAPDPDRILAAVLEAAR
jgi:ADP-heptose:LPS heptosyltransferase